MQGGERFVVGANVRHILSGLDQTLVFDERDTAIWSPFGVVIIVGLFISLPVYAASRSDDQYVYGAVAFVEDDSPIARCAVAFLCGPA